MPDWTEIVKIHLGQLGLDPQREGEIVAELAAHLEELYEEFRRQGSVEEEAVKQALAGVADWREFRRQIRCAEKCEGVVNQRTKRVWLPGLSAVAICFVSMQFVGYVTSKLLANPVGIKVVGPILFGALLLGFIAAGAGAAYVSRWMGGGLWHQVLGALLPAAILLACLLISLIGLPQVKVANPQMKFNLLPFVLVLLPVIVSLLLLTGVLFARLQSKWSSRAGPDSQSGSTAGKCQQTTGALLNRWMHRFRLSHA